MKHNAFLDLLKRSKWCNRIDTFDFDHLKEDYCNQTPCELIERSLIEPISSDPLSDLVADSKRILICVPDSTRRFDKDSILKFILSMAGKNKELRLITASGNHSKETLKESGISIVSEADINWEFHDSKDKRMMHHFGSTEVDISDFFEDFLKIDKEKTEHDPAVNFAKDEPFAKPVINDPEAIVNLQRGLKPTEVWLNRLILWADLIITIGLVKPHYFAGFSGGAKALLPGIAFKDSISQNHKKRVHPKSDIGIVEKNPAREDLEQGVTLIERPIFSINVVAAPDGYIIDVFSGDFRLAFREAAGRVLKIFGKDVRTKYDIVVVMAGSPVGDSLYQFTKAIASATKFVKKGGVIAGFSPDMRLSGDITTINSEIYRFGIRPKAPEGVHYLLYARKDILRGNKSFVLHYTDIEEFLSKMQDFVRGYADVLVIKEGAFVCPIIYRIC